MNTAWLSRHAAGLPAIQFDHAAFLINDAARRNIAQGHFQWARELLLAFVPRCVREGRQDVAAGATEMMHGIARAGGANQAVPAGEDVSAFVTAVDAATGADEVKACVTRLTRG